MLVRDYHIFLDQNNCHTNNHGKAIMYHYCPSSLTSLCGQKWHNIHTKFRENRVTGTEVGTGISLSHRQHGNSLCVVTNTELQECAYFFHRVHQNACSNFSTSEWILMTYNIGNV
jgi:hypothetical protein